MNKIRITYYGDEAPKIEADNLADLERIELIDGEERRWLFMEHNGVKVYHTDRYQDISSDYYFSPIRGLDSDDEEAFDVTTALSPIPENEMAHYELMFPAKEHTLRAGLEAARKREMAYAIDQGRLTTKGLS